MFLFYHKSSEDYSAMKAALKIWNHNIRYSLLKDKNVISYENVFYEIKKNLNFP
jgi:hypothetical protein